MTNQLSGALGELRATVQITRKATGKVEEYQIVSGISDEKQHEQLITELNKEKQNGTDA